MGCEIAQEREWSEERSVDWHLADDPSHRGVQLLVKALNDLYATEPALHERDHDPAGFTWVDASDADQSVLSFLRWPDEGGRPVLCVANLTPVPRHSYRVGVPQEGDWVELLNTDAADFGGSGVGNGGHVHAGGPAWHGQASSVPLTLPPLGVLWLAPSAGD
jgi:1,4-alpha-glucan branching enzyme